MLPAFLRMKSSPGSDWVSRMGSTLESEQVMKSAREVWLSDSRVKNFFSFQRPRFSLPVALQSVVLNVPVNREHEHPLADRDINIRKQRERFGTRNLVHLLAQLVAALSD